MAGCFFWGNRPLFPFGQDQDRTAPRAKKIARRFGESLDRTEKHQYNMYVRLKRERAQRSPAVIHRLTQGFFLLLRRREGGQFSKKRRVLRVVFCVLFAAWELAEGSGMHGKRRTLSHACPRMRVKVVFMRQGRGFRPKGRERGHMAGFGNKLWEAADVSLEPCGTNMPGRLLSFNT